MEMSKRNLWALRTEITLGSLYTSDYENSFQILPRMVQDFFDGYIEYLWELAEENNKKADIDFEDLAEISDMIKKGTRRYRYVPMYSKYLIQ